MSKHYDTQLRLQDQLVSRIKQVYHIAEKYHYPHKWILSRRSEIWSSSDRKRCCTWTVEYIRGYEKALFDGLYEYPNSKLVFAYDVNGRRYAIDDPEYKALDPCYVNRAHTWSGYVWRANIHCNFS